MCGQRKNPWADPKDQADYINVHKYFRNTILHGKPYQRADWGTINLTQTKITIIKEIQSKA